MKALIVTQTRENYGEAEQQFWKNSGGSEYFVLNVNPSNFADIVKFAETLNRADDFFEEYVVGVSFVEDDYMSEFEKSQLEYDGKISYPAKILEM